jgi:hypothetical protein
LIALAPLTRLSHQIGASSPIDDACLHEAGHDSGSASLHAADCQHLPAAPHHDGATCPACRSLSQGRTSLVADTVIGPPVETPRRLFAADSTPRALAALRSSTAPRAPPVSA